MVLPLRFIAALLLLIGAAAQAEWRVAPNGTAPDRPAYWVADINGMRVEAVLNDYRVQIGRPCLGNEVRPAGAYSLRWMDVGPNPLAGMCHWVEASAPPRIQVTWDHNGTDTQGLPVTVDGFTVYSERDGADLPPVTLPTGEVREFFDTSVSAGHRYCYSLTAHGRGLESARSATACTDL